MLALAPFAVVYVLPNVHAHLSAFSRPLRSYQALSSGSVTVFASSWAMVLAMASAPALPFGPMVWVAQAPGQRSGLPTKTYLRFLPSIVPRACQPQCRVQKPEVSFTSAEVSTK